MQQNIESTQICRKCEEERPLSDFKVTSEYKNKKGEVRRYRARTCKECVYGHSRNMQRERERDQIHQLISWSVPAVIFATVIGIYQSEMLSGRNKICFYESVYGQHAMTIDALEVCPMTQEFEV
jgi:hypothetical protein